MLKCLPFMTCCASPSNGAITPHPHRPPLGLVINRLHCPVRVQGSGTLCEALLMVEAYRGNIVCPNKHVRVAGFPYVFTATTAVACHNNPRPMSSEMPNSPLRSMRVCPEFCPVGSGGRPPSLSHWFIHSCCTRGFSLSCRVHLLRCVFVMIAFAMYVSTGMYLLLLYMFDACGFCSPLLSGASFFPQVFLVFFVRCLRLSH